jgi:hypothetical protein
MGFCGGNINKSKARVVRSIHSTQYKPLVHMLGYLCNGIIVSVKNISLVLT